MLARILTEPRNTVVKQYKSLLAMDNASLEISDEAIMALAKMAMKSKVGARGLRSVLVSIYVIYSFEQFFVIRFVFF